MSKKKRIVVIRARTIDDMTLQRRKMVKRLRIRSTVKVFTNNGRSEALGTIIGIDHTQGFLHIKLEKGGRPNWYIPQFVQRY